MSPNYAWMKFYEAAVLETDPESLPSRIEVAQNAIGQRVIERGRQRFFAAFAANRGPLRPQASERDAHTCDQEIRLGMTITVESDERLEQRRGERDGQRIGRSFPSLASQSNQRR
jgi:hypothetical protein